MNIIFLGTNGFAPTDDAQTVCCMLPEVGIVLDAGSGCFRVPQYQQTDDLSIYLSHAHDDHTIGIAYLASGFLGKVTDQARRENHTDDYQTILAATDAMIARVTIYAVESVIERAKAHLGDRSMNWQPLEPDHVLPGNGKMTCFPLEHTAECYGFRFDWEDRSLAYVTDTTAATDADYVQYIEGVDVLIHDAYLPDSWAAFARQIGHSHVSAVAQVAAYAGVGHLILTHHNTAGLELDLEAARTIFPQTLSAYDGLEISF